jgi:hypothetical protein
MRPSVLSWILSLVPDILCFFLLYLAGEGLELRATKVGNHGGMRNRSTLSIQDFVVVLLSAYCH